MKFWRKKWFWAILLLAIFIAFCSLLEPKITHIVLNDGKTKVKIPEEIVAKQDCELYHQWFYSHVTPLAKWSDRCPWSKPPKGPVGQFIVGGTKFWIPREYLWPNQKEPDGNTEHILLLLVYPEMTPVTDNDKNSKCEKERYCTIKVSIQLSNNHIGCKLNNCDIAGYEYKYSLDSSRLDVKNNKISPQKIEYLSDLDLTLYTVDTTNDQYYVRGDKLQPDYWLKCHPGSRYTSRNKGTPLCESKYNLNQDIYIEYSFGKTDLLIHHDDVRKKILKKLNEWQQNQGEIK